MIDGNKKGSLGRRLVENMARMTADRVGGQVLENALRNQAHLARGKSISVLRNAPLGDGDTAIVIAAGPSISRQDPASILRETNYKGCVIATDSAVAYCLRNDIVPHLIVSLDPHATRIVRWFGDTELNATNVSSDDYYRRQDMDEAFSDEIAFNQRVIGLVNEAGPNMTIALATSASQRVVDRVLDAGINICWWNPMMDDLDQPESQTRVLKNLNGLPCINAGGNVGAAAWMIADAVLGKRSVALTGFDFSYYPETSINSSQYYHEAVKLVGEENIDSLFMWVMNPHINKEFFTDPAYMWYRESFLSMVLDAECKTYNCTEGGILFGDGIDFIKLRDFLAIPSSK